MEFMGELTELVRRVQGGDREALERLVKRYHGPIRGYLYHIVHGDIHLADDLTQETFLTMVRKLPQLREPSAFKAWLYRIAGNTARDYFRSAQAREVPADPVRNDDAAAVGTEPEAEAFRDHDRMLVLGLLRELEEHHREVLILRYYQDLELNEIAEILDVPLGTVKSRLHYALRRMKEAVLEREVVAREP